MERTLKQVLQAAERDYWLKLIPRVGHTVRALGDAAGISPSTAWRRLRALGIVIEARVTVRTRREA